MVIRATWLAAVILVCGAGFSSVAAAGDGEEINNYQTPVKERVVCRREPVTGSHMKRKICRTERQMREDQAVARDRLKEMQDLRDAEIRMEAVRNPGR